VRHLRQNLSLFICLIYWYLARVSIGLREGCIVYFCERGGVTGDRNVTNRAAVSGR